MQKISLLFLLITIIACSKKTIPATTSTESKQQLPSTEKADVAKETPLTEDKPLSTEPIKKDPTQNDLLVVGQRIYIMNCGKCHELYAAEKFTAQRWDEILKKMIPKAKLNAEQGKQVTDYIKANAKK